MRVSRKNLPRRRKRNKYNNISIYNLAEMPIEIICKYWMRIYTLEKGKFYTILNNGLKEKKFKLFLPYIKMMYEGIKKGIQFSYKPKAL